MWTLLRFVLLLFVLAPAVAEATTPFWVRIVDAETGRGVPLVRISAPDYVKWTDSNGVAVVDDARLQGRDVTFAIESAGYVFEPKQGAAIRVEAGKSVELQLRRLNIAERLYRATGANIYGDSVRAGLTVPIAKPLINARVTGQDTVIATIYKGKIFWCWGDTDGELQADGKKRFNGKVSCATSELPGKGGLDPSVGIDYTYFTRPDGFTRQMVPIPVRGLVWIEGLFTVKDEQGRERLLATYTIQQAKTKPFESGIVAFDDAAGEFRVIARFPPRPRHTSSHPFVTRVDGKDYLYLYPVQRVPFEWKAILDPGRYESYTCLKSGAKLDMENPPLERDATGKLVCGWKHDADWLTGDRERALLTRGLIDIAHANFPLLNTKTGKPTGARADSVAWNRYRNKWILLSKDNGTVYYSEADQPQGPWVKAVPVSSQLPYRLYNVARHPFFDSADGRFIYYEGTFIHKLSQTDVVVPDYDYNNLVYRLDLSDPRLEAARTP